MNGNLIYKGKERLFFEFAYTADFESPLERDFLINGLRRVSNDIDIYYQYPVGKYRVDYVLGDGDVKIGIEIDGKEYHQNPFKDDERDAEILSHGVLKWMLRFRGKDVWHNYIFVMAVIAGVYPRFFDEHENRFFERYVAAREKEDGLFWCDDNEARIISYVFRCGEYSERRRLRMNYGKICA